MNLEPAIGIDLGTTNACVAIFHKDKAEIINNDQDYRKTPSYVAFTDTERLIGDAAKSQLALNPSNTVYNVKRLIGRRYDDPIIQNNKNHLPFSIINQSGKLKISVEFKSEVKQFHPEEISGMLLAKMKEIAERFLNKKVKNAVITVPASFNDSQRQATKDAAKLAGLSVLRIINEPTAAAIAFMSDRKIKGQKYILFFDLGGGCFDVSIAKLGYDSIEVKSTSGDSHLGGDDFDERLLNYFVDEFKSKHQKDITSNKRALTKLKIACEKAKRILSTNSQTNIEIDSLYDNIDFISNLTRNRFEELCDDLFKKTLEHVEIALKNARLEKSQIDEIIMIGGSTRIPKLQKLLQNFFDGKELNKSMNPDEAAATGAAIQAGILTGLSSDLIITDIVQHSIGFETFNGDMFSIFKIGTKLPAKYVHKFTTISDNQSGILIKVYEGERSKAKNNHYIGKFQLDGVMPAQKNVPQIEVTFNIDTNGIFDITNVSDKSNWVVFNKIIIKRDKDRMNQEEISLCLKDIEKYKKYDELECERLSSKNSLESYCFNLKFLIENEKTNIINACEDTIKWLENNQLADKEEYDYKFREVEETFLKIVNKLYSNRLQISSDFSK